MLATVPPVAVKFAVVAPEFTVTVDSTVNAALFEDNDTNDPPAGAVCASVTVHVDVPPDAMLVGEQLSPETDCTTVIVPPLPATVVHVPSEAEPITLLTASGTTVLLVGLNLAEMDATTPLPIGVPSIPLTTQLIEPVPGLHVSVLLPELSAVPGDIVNETMSLGAYESVHCILDGAVAEEASERFNVIEPPGIDIPDPSEREF